MPTIFVLDNDDDILMAINIWLSRNGYIVYTFNHTAALFQTLQNILPDIILLDVLLSDLKDGKWVCAELKQRYQYPHKVYLFSASAIRQQDLLQCGADGFISKPFDLQELLEILQAAIYGNSFNK